MAKSNEPQVLLPNKNQITSVSISLVQGGQVGIYSVEPKQDIIDSYSKARANGGALKIQTGNETEDLKDTDLVIAVEHILILSVSTIVPKSAIIKPPSGIQVM